MKVFLKYSYYYLYIIPLFVINSHAQSITNNNISLKYIGEHIINSNSEFKKTKFGGLSSIDYTNGKWFSICDDSNLPIRFYELKFFFNDSLFKSVTIKDVHFLKNSKNENFAKNSIDGESLRYDSLLNKVIWTSEGNIKHSIPPALYSTDLNTGISNLIKLEKPFSNTKNFYHNGAFESLSLTNKGYWIATEYPLTKDGSKPSFTENNSPVRISFIDKETHQLTKQYAYILDKIAFKPKNKTDNGNNGLVEILTLNNYQFLTLERSYTNGMENVIKLFLSSAYKGKTTNISSFNKLTNSQFIPLEKKLLLNFKDIKELLPSNTIDNIEGMCFGPKLKDGSETLVFISDNNFNKYGNQITQVIVFSFSKTKQ